MNVLHVISSGGMYGAEAVILGLSHQLAQHADRSTVAVFSNASLALHDRARAEGIPALKITCARQFDLATIGSLREAARLSEADVVHAHGYKADLFAFLALRNERVALVSTCHTWYDNDAALRLYGFLDRVALKRFGRVVAVSAEVESRLLRSGVRAGRVRRIRNGVVVPEARVWSAEPKVLHAGLVGRLSPEKGVDTFLRAASLVVKELPQVRFTVFGEGPERTQLEALLVSLQLGNSVELVGHTENMQRAFGSLDLLVSASRQEGLPMALLEGMAAGLPVVGTKVGEIPTLVRDGVDGLLVEPANPEALAAAMLRLLRDESLRHRCSANARERIQQEFSVAHMAEAYREVYAEALAEVRA